LGNIHASFRDEEHNKIRPSFMMGTQPVVRRIKCPVCASVAHRCASRPVRETARSITGVGAKTEWAGAAATSDAKDSLDDDPDVPAAEGCADDPLPSLPLLLSPPLPPAGTGAAAMSQQSLLRSTWLKACLCILAVADGGALIRPATPLMGVLAAAASAFVPAASGGGNTEPRGFPAGSGDPCPSLPLVAAMDGIGEDAWASPFAREPAELAAVLPLVVSVIFVY